MKAKPIAKNCLICNNLKGWSIKAAHNLWVKSTLTSILAARKDQLEFKKDIQKSNLYNIKHKKELSAPNMDNQKHSIAQFKIIQSFVREM